MFRTALCCAMLVVAITSSVAAQRTPAPGDTVRLQMTQPARTVSGVVVRWSTSEIEIQEDATSIRQVPASSIIGVKIKSGRRSAAGRGALTGLAIGGVTGLALGVVAMSDDSGFIDFGPEVVIGGAVILGGAGALTGAVVGLFIRREAWVAGQVPGGAIQAGTGRHAGPSVVVAPGAAGTWRVGMRLR